MTGIISFQENLGNWLEVFSCVRFEYLSPFSLDLPIVTTGRDVMVYIMISLFVVFFTFPLVCISLVLEPVNT